MTPSRPIVLPARLSGVIRLNGAAPAIAPAATPVAGPIPPSPAPPPAPAPDLTAARERAEIQAVLGRLGQAVQDMNARQNNALGELQRAAVEIGMAVAARLVHEQIQVDAFGVEGLVRDLMRHLQPRLPVTVSLHPADLALLQKRVGADGPLASVAVELRADASLGRGDCQARTGDLCVAADLPRQLREMREALLEGLPFDPRGPDERV